MMFVIGMVNDLFNRNGIAMVKATLRSTAFIRGKFMVLMWDGNRWALAPLARVWKWEITHPAPVGIRIVSGVKIRI